MRCEFDGFEPVAMTGGTVAHDRISFNLQKALDARLGGKPCQPFGPNVKILTPGRARYPDALVTCAPIDPRATVIDEPVVVFDVLNDDTARIDRIDKVREYQATSSIQRYVIVEQKSIGATVFARQGAIWAGFAVTAEETPQMPEIGVEIPLTELYTGLDLPERPEDAGTTVR